MIKIYEDDNTKKITYRIDHYGSWDNGHVLHSYKKDTIDNAEQEAKLASIKDKNNLYYVSKDNIMDPTTDYSWYRGKQYHDIQDKDKLTDIKKEINNRRADNKRTTDESISKSYWKFNLDDPIIDRIRGNGDYFDKYSIKKIKLYPCDTEDDCYIGDSDWAVCSYEFPHNAIFGTKEEAYEELMYYINNNFYEMRNDL